jgi:hypothetical protein
LALTADRPGWYRGERNRRGCRDICRRDRPDPRREAAPISREAVAPGVGAGSGRGANSGIPIAPERSAPAVGAEHGQRAGVPPWPDLTRGPGRRGPRNAAVAYAAGAGAPTSRLRNSRAVGCHRKDHGHRAAPIPREAVARVAGGLLRSRRAAARRAGGAGARAAAGRWRSASWLYSRDACSFRSRFEGGRGADYDTPLPLGVH